MIREVSRLVLSHSGRGGLTHTGAVTPGPGSRLTPRPQSPLDQESQDTSQGILRPHALAAERSREQATPDSVMASETLPETRWTKEWVMAQYF